MNKEVTNSIWKLQWALEELRNCDQYDFEDDDADDLDKLHSRLESLCDESESVIYTFQKMVDRLRVERRREEELEYSELESKYRYDLNKWWNDARI